MDATENDHVPLQEPQGLDCNVMVLSRCRPSRTMWIPRANDRAYPNTRRSSSNERLSDRPTLRYLNGAQKSLRRSTALPAVRLKKAMEVEVETATTGKGKTEPGIGGREEESGGGLSRIGHPFSIAAA